MASRDDDQATRGAGDTGGGAPRGPVGGPDMPTRGDLPADISGRGDLIRAMASGLLDRPGDMIGPYHLLSILGEGGFGVVWLAERRTDLIQRVALKIIKPGMDSASVLARFEQERQALAVMDHPNVAKVFDAGATETGRPYFVMEYVQGDTITGYCDKQLLSTRQRLELFISVCEAVQHAHMKGIIHRDLKPSNVLIAVKDGQAIPKVIDFGVAKAISRTLIDKTIFTEQGQILGTPEYMSPEQAEMGAMDIDTRTDVYSLGVVLYELLTGALPFDSRTLRSKGYAEIQRIIREVDPPRPSTRLSTAGEGVPVASENAVAMGLSDAPPPTATEVARQHSTDAATLLRELRRDLDWVILKALEKDRTRRYETPTALAADIRRYLSDEPVVAGPPTIGYRVGKFVRRNKLPLAMVAAVALSLVIGLALAISGFLEASRQRDIARDNAHRANLEATHALAANKFSRQMLQRAKAYAGLDKDLTVRQMMDAGVQALEHGALQSEPEAEFQARVTIAVAYFSMSRYSQAHEQIVKALALREAAKETSDGEYAAALLVLGEVQSEEGLLGDAEKTMTRAATIQSRLSTQTDEPMLDIRHQIAVLRSHQDRLDEAERELRAILDDYAATNRDTTAGAADVRKNLAGVLFMIPGKIDEAITEANAAVAQVRAAYGDGTPQYGEALQNLAVMQRQQGLLPAAVRNFRAALMAVEQSLPSPHDTIAQVQNNLAGTLRDLGLSDQAEPLARRSLEARRTLLGNQHSGTADALDVLGGILLDKGDADGAVAAFREQRAIREKLEGATPISISGSMVGLAQALIATKNLSEAERIAFEAWTARQTVLEKGDWRLASAAATLGNARCQSGKAADGEALLLESASVLEKAAAAPARVRLYGIQALISCLFDRKKEQDALRWKGVVDAIRTERDRAAQEASRE